MELEEKWEVAIAQYFQCFSWIQVAETLNLKKKTIYSWLQNPEFKKMLSFEQKKLVKELNDKFIFNTELAHSHLKTLIEQNDDLKIKLDAVKEYNRKFEKLEELRLVEESIELAEESKKV